MKNTKRKGFTIVELVIVIAVIAILAAVLIPTFASLINKANRSADIQAVTNMNKVLVAESAAGNVSDLQKVLSVLKDGGIDAKNYKAMSDGYKIVWDSELNRILYTKGMMVEHPAEYSKEYENSYVLKYWVELTGKRFGDDSWSEGSNGTALDSNSYSPVDGTTLTGLTDMKKYTVKTPAQLASLAEVINATDNNGANMVIELEKDATYDMLGAEWDIVPEFAGIFNGNGATIKNLAITDKELNLSSDHVADDGNYKFYAFISSFTGKYFGNVTLDVNIDAPGVVNTQNHTVAGALGKVCAKAESDTVTVDNVTVSGTVHGPYRAAGIIGFIGGNKDDFASGKVYVQNCTNKANVTCDICESTFNTAGGIVSILNRMTDKAEVRIKDCTNEGTISGQVSGGILAISFATTSSVDYGAATAYIYDCENKGEITAKHDSVTEAQYGSIIQDDVGLADIFGGYNKQASLYVLDCTVRDGKQSFGKTSTNEDTCSSTAPTGFSK